MKSRKPISDWAIKTQRRSIGWLAVNLLALAYGCGKAAAPDIQPPQDLSKPFATATGKIQTYSTAGKIDLDNPFFQSLGSNDRRCSSCHRAEDAWTITPAHLKPLFEETDGLDPVFRKNDGANSPAVDDSTVQSRRVGYSMLLQKGVIRVGIGIPDDAEFELIAADDPYQYASARELSLFRRPPSSTNLKFLTTVMWDGREALAGESIDFDLLHQSNEATIGHAQAAQALSYAQRRQIVDLENSLFTAAIEDTAAGPLNGGGANGGPVALAEQNFYNGINDVLGADPKGHPFDRLAFDIYSAWSQLKGGDPRSEARRSVARGQLLFETKTIHITGVKGLNDALHVADITGSCTTCHDTPNAGNHSVPLPIDIGVSDEVRRTADLPLYSLRNKTTQEVIKTTDPGRALVTGRWKDIGKFKGPILRALSARAPYFHNGMAADLDAVVDFYDKRFEIHLNELEKSDLAAFLRAL